MVWIIGGHLLLLLFHNSREYTVNEALMYYLPLEELESHIYMHLFQLKMMTVFLLLHLRTSQTLFNWY